MHFGLANFPVAYCGLKIITSLSLRFPGFQRKKYSQLTDVQRYQIEALKKAEKDQKTIASIIGVSASTISRELKRNTGQRGYRPKQAHIKALKRRKESAKVIKMTEGVITIIETKIQLDWSPEQVSGWLNKGHDILSISHERIYQHVREDKRQGGALYKPLRYSHKKRKKQYGGKDKRGQIKNRVSIDERPEIVVERGESAIAVGPVVLSESER
ncbi:Mobile element protein [methanotrophic endosymbiont of Bathymodiolus azoricus (Menez Gwen)]|nr:Mobile element protein [methanotrophic endosymbiont of Bathymodiolus azoricus (Menez Gwen)]